jgi:hypothetical protein
MIENIFMWLLCTCGSWSNRIFCCSVAIMFLRSAPIFLLFKKNYKEEYFIYYFHFLGHKFFLIVMIKLYTLFFERRGLPRFHALTKPGSIILLSIHNHMYVRICELLDLYCVSQKKIERPTK